jgi:Arc/MetJ-type ribon-helix-helix transcriptional regulator
MVLFFKKTKTVRITDEVQEKINKLLELYPNKFGTGSQIIRSSVFKLYNSEVDNNGRRKNKDM